jgi:AcrR family transcriptional regulator/transposase-like protein
MTDVKVALFNDAGEARAALEALRWPVGPVCPHCDSTKAGAIRGNSHRAGLYRCAACAAQFTVTIQTFFEGSKIPLHKWWLAAYRLDASEKAASINQLHRDLGVTYKSAWFMAQRLRTALKAHGPAAPPKLAQARDAAILAYFKAAKLKPSPALLRTARSMAALIAHDRGGSQAARASALGAQASLAKRRRDPQSTRELILEVACRQLAKVGHEGLSLTEVAQLAGVNRGTAYHHFKTREKLVKATTDWVSGMLYDVMFGDAAALQQRPIEDLHVPDLNDRLASFALQKPDLCRVWFLEVLASPNPSDDLFWREYQGMTERWSKSKFAQPNVDFEVATVITLAGHFLWPVWVQGHFKGRPIDQKLARRFTNELLRLSMFGSLRAEHYPDIVKRLQAPH